MDSKVFLGQVFVAHRCWQEIVLVGLLAVAVEGSSEVVVVFLLLAFPVVSIDFFNLRLLLWLLSAVATMVTTVSAT